MYCLTKMKWIIYLLNLIQQIIIEHATESLPFQVQTLLMDPLNFQDLVINQALDFIRKMDNFYIWSVVENLSVLYEKNIAINTVSTWTA